MRRGRAMLPTSGPIPVITVRSLNVNTRSADESDGVCVGEDAYYMCNGR